MNIELSPKQCEFINNATHRYNGKIGATQCGKTYVDISYVIPDRILERKGKQGLNLILGVTKETIERNVLEPMRDYWGNNLIGTINNRNISILFGEKVYCLGAEKVSQVSKLRGAKFKYVYIDELVDCNEEVFALLKSRLSLPYSICDFTGNPKHPKHFVKKFIDSDADVYCQSWEIDDNPFLDPRVVEELKKEYAGTVYYYRYIKGMWMAAEGLIYRIFANNPKRYFLRHRLENGDINERFPLFQEINAAFDPGGTTSKHAFVASGITPNYKQLIAIRSERHEADGTTPGDLDVLACNFVEKVIKDYGRLDYLYYDNEASVLGRGIKKAVEKKFPQVSVRPCVKGEIKDRIDLEIRLLGLDRFKYTEDCETLKEALEESLWDDKHDDVRLDDGTTPIDDLDAFEYTFTPQIKRFIQ